MLGYNSCERKDTGLAVRGDVDFVELFCTADGDSRLTVSLPTTQVCISGVTRKFVRVGGVQQIQLRVEDRENGDLGGGSPLVRGSGGSCNLVQEISFHIVKFS